MRNIKRAKEVLAQKKEEIKRKERRDAEREKLGGTVGRFSEVDSNSIKDADGHSVASFSAMGGYAASQRVDIKKVEQINMNL